MNHQATGTTFNNNELAKVSFFTLILGDGSNVAVPCTEVSPDCSQTVLAAAIHHLTQRVVELEKSQENGVMTKLEELKVAYDAAAYDARDADAAYRDELKKIQEENTND